MLDVLSAPGSCYHGGSPQPVLAMPLQASSNTPRPVVDLGGPQGNTICLYGLVAQYGKQLRWPTDKIKALQADLLSDDYLHAVRAFDAALGEYLTILVPEALEAELVEADTR